MLYCVMNIGIILKSEKENKRLILLNYNQIQYLGGLNEVRQKLGLEK